VPLNVNSTSTVLCDGWAKYEYTVRITRKDAAACAIYAVVLFLYVVAKNNLHN